MDEINGEVVLQDSFCFYLLLFICVFIFFSCFSITYSSVVVAALSSLPLSLLFACGGHFSLRVAFSGEWVANSE